MYYDNIHLIQYKMTNIGLRKKSKIPSVKYINVCRLLLFPALTHCRKVVEGSMDPHTNCISHNKRYKDAYKDK